MAENETPKNDPKPSPPAEPAAEAQATEQPPKPEVSQTDQFLAGLTTDDREAIVRMAAERQQQLDNPAEPKPPVKEPVKPTSDNPLDELTDRLEGVEKILRAREEKDKEAAARQEQVSREQAFYASLDGILDKDETYGEDADEREMIKEAYMGAWLKNRYKDIPGSFRTFLEKRKARDEKWSERDRANYITRKLKVARTTRDESGGGPAPAKSEYQPTGDDMDSGALAERIKKEMGVA